MGGGGWGRGLGMDAGEGAGESSLAIKKGCIADSGIGLYRWLGSRLANLSRKQAGIPN